MAEKIYTANPFAIEPMKTAGYVLRGNSIKREVDTIGDTKST